MNLIDLFLILTLAATIGLCAQRRVSGLVVGLGGIILFKPLLWIATFNAFVALFLALLLGAGLGLGGRLLSRALRLDERLGMLLGGIGGALLGFVLIIGTVTSLPIVRDFNGRLTYASNLPLGLTAVARQSDLVALGRDVVFYEVLTDSGVTSANPAFIRTLHGFFISGQPWTRL